VPPNAHAPSSDPDRFDGPDGFVDLVGGLDYPMFVVTTAAGGERAGCLVGFVTQTSIGPPRLLVCLSKVNHTTQVAGRAAWLGVHVLREGDEALARLFGEITENRDPVDKFEHVEWRPGPGGVPILEGVDCIVGRVMVRIPYLGDHVGHLLTIDETVTDARRARRPQLGFQALKHLEAGNPATPDPPAGPSAG
jgi:flavin reductase (DIM6/NTAB) family NADH-FMN oxidoreductase RutF